MAKSNLVIVESPAKAKTIGKYLGPDYQVLASMGHVRDLPKSKMGVDLESGDFTPNYQPIPGKEEVIEELKDAADHSQKVYLATDPDREGGHFLASERAVGPAGRQGQPGDLQRDHQDSGHREHRRPGEIDQNLVDAQQARRILDGSWVTTLPLLWKKIRRGLCAGRVQVGGHPAGAEREEEIGPSCPRSTGP